MSCGKHDVFPHIHPTMWSEESNLRTSLRESTNMNPSENLLPTQLDLQPPATPSGSSRNANRMLLLTASLVVTALAFCVSVGPHTIVDRPPAGYDCLHLYPVPSTTSAARGDR